MLIKTFQTTVKGTKLGEEKDEVEGWQMHHETKIPITRWVCGPSTRITFGNRRSLASEPQPKDLHIPWNLDGLV